MVKVTVKPLIFYLTFCGFCVIPCNGGQLYTSKATLPNGLRPICRYRKKIIDRYIIGAKLSFPKLARCLLVFDGGFPDSGLNIGALFD